MKHRREITDRQYSNVYTVLSDISPLFSEMWRTQPRAIFDDGEDTAGLEIHDVDGVQTFRICFNPEYWDRSSVLKRVFIICHEYMHVIFGHWLSASQVDVWKNIAQDIQVNEFLISRFPIFNTKEVLIAAPTVDMVFKEKASKVLRNGTSEYYYSLILKCL